MKHTWKKPTAFIMAMALVAGFAPANVGTGGLCIRANAKGEFTKTAENTTLGTTGIEAPSSGSKNADWTGNYVYYGNYNGAPVKYRVLAPSTTDFGGTTMLLDCDAVLIKMHFHSSSNAWSSSDVKAWLNGDAFYKNTSVFTSPEKGAITQSLKAKPAAVDGDGDDKLNWTPLTGENIFLLDAKEAYSPSYGYSNTYSSKTRKKSGTPSSWWLRSPSIPYHDGAGYVEGYFFWIAEEDVDEDFMGPGVSPAFNVDLSSVIFSSVISGESTAASGKAYKLTLKNDRFGIGVTNGSFVEAEGKTITVPYTVTDSDAALTPDTVSVLIKDTSGEILYYAPLTETYAARGTGTFTLPDALRLSDWGTGYTVSILAEDVNGQYETDYASEPCLIDYNHTDISNAAVALDADNMVSSITVGDKRIVDLSKDFVITYGATAETATTDFPTTAGKYFAFVTAKKENEHYKGTAVSEQFVIKVSKPRITEIKHIEPALNKPFNLDEYFDVEFVDSRGRDVDYLWEAKERKAKGITFNDNNEVIFTQNGTFHVRVYDPDDINCYSDYVEIIVVYHGADDIGKTDVTETDDLVEADNGTTFEFSGSYKGLVGAEPDAIEGEPSTVIAEDSESGIKQMSHGRLQVDALDERDKEINVAYTWEAMEEEGITLTEDGKVSFTQPGTYHVRIQSGDFYSDWYEITAAETSEEYSAINFVNPDGILIDHIKQTWGSAVTAPAAPEKRGYIFKGWSADIPETMPADPITLTAQWEIDDSVERVLIKGNVRGAGHLAVSENGEEPVFDEEYPTTSLNNNTVKGDTLIYSAKADEGWVFKEWQHKATGEVYSKDATITITADTPLDLVAVFDTEDAVTEHKLTDAEMMQWTAKDYKDKTGTDANVAITGWSDDEYEITITDDDDKVLDTYTINPDTGIGTNAAGEEVNLPQTGMSGAHKALAGLAALMTLTGIALVKKSRKKEEN